MISAKQYICSSKTMTSNADKGLIQIFLKMTPEKRIRTNDNAIKAMLELRNAFKQKTNSGSRFKSPA